MRSSRSLMRLIYSTVRICFWPPPISELPLLADTHARPQTPSSRSSTWRSPVCLSSVCSLMRPRRTFTSIGLTRSLIAVMGIFEQDVHADALIAFPALYGRGIRGEEYGKSKFWWCALLPGSIVLSPRTENPVSASDRYTLSGIYQSAICFFIPLLVYGQGATWCGSAPLPRS